MVMVGNGGRQEGSLLKTPFYVHLHDTKHKCLENKNINTVTTTIVLGYIMAILAMAISFLYICIFVFSYCESGGKCFANTSTMFAQRIVFLR